MPRTRATWRRACGASSRPIPGAHLNGASRAAACPASSTCRFAGVEGESLITGLAGIAVSTGLGLQLRDARAELRAARARARAPSSRRARCGCRWDVSRRPRTSTRPPRPSAPRSRACVRWRATVEPGAAGRRSGPAGGPAGSLLAQCAEPARAPLLPGAAADSGISGRAAPARMCARGGPEGRPTGPRCASSCKLPTGL